MGHINQSRVSNVRLFVHQKCRRNYTDPKWLKTSLPCETSVPKKKLRLCSSNAFQWNNTCFICGVKCSVDKKHPERNVVYEVRTLQFRDSIINACNKRDDQWNHKIKLRLVNCIYLVAEEPIYQKSCYTRLMLGKSISSASATHTPIAGRHKDSHMMVHFNSLCQWVENEADAELYSITELHSKMIVIKWP